MPALPSHQNNTLQLSSMITYTENLVDYYAASFRRNWSLPALSEYGELTTLTYGDFARRIARIHLFYELAGVKPGDKIALVGKNNATWVTVFMATITYGAIIVPILQDFNPQDTQHIINHSESVMVFVSQHIWETMGIEDLPMVRAAISLETRRMLAERSDSNMYERILKNLTRKFKRRFPHGFTPECVEYHHAQPDDTAVINYTSGTTGFSKGVMLTYNNLAGNVLFGAQSRLHYQGSRCLCFLPLAHAYGCAFDLLTPLAVGTHVTLFGRVPVPRLLLKALAEVKPNLVLCVPLILEKIYRKQIVPMLSKRAIRWVLAIPMLDTAIYAKIRRKLVDAFGGEFEEVIVGGAPLNREVESFLSTIHFPFTVGYGMTECGPLISYTPWRQFVPTSSGRVLPNMEVKVLSADPANVPGEICVRGQNVMKGYFKNPEATEAVLDEDGWLHTGDMGTVVDDTIFIRGRYKTMILTGSGQNIYPEEIEAKLNNMPYVAESLVVERGGGLTAIVYPDYEAVDADKILPQDLPKVMEQVRIDLNKIVAPYEQVQRIQLIPNEFEKTPKKSIKRYLYNQ